MFAQTTKKKIFAGVFLVIVSIWGYHKLQKYQPQIVQFVSDNWNEKVADPVKPNLSEVEAVVFLTANENLLKHCADNKYGLNEDACIQTIGERKDMCQQWSTQKHKGMAPGAERMELAIGSHINCIFHWELSSSSM